MEEYSLNPLGMSYRNNPSTMNEQGDMMKIHQMFQDTSAAKQMTNHFPTVTQCKQSQNNTSSSNYFQHPFCRQDTSNQKDFETPRKQVRFCEESLNKQNGSDEPKGLNLNQLNTIDNHVDLRYPYHDFLDQNQQELISNSSICSQVSNQLSSHQAQCDQKQYTLCDQKQYTLAKFSVAIPDSDGLLHLKLTKDQLDQQGQKTIPLQSNQDALESPGLKQLSKQNVNYSSQKNTNESQDQVNPNNQTRYVHPQNPNMKLTENQRTDLSQTQQSNYSQQSNNTQEIEMQNQLNSKQLQYDIQQLLQNSRSQDIEAVCNMLTSQFVLKDNCNSHKYNKLSQQTTVNDPQHHSLQIDMHRQGISNNTQQQFKKQQPNSDQIFQHQYEYDTTDYQNLGPLNQEYVGVFPVYNQQNETPVQPQTVTEPRINTRCTYPLQQPSQNYNSVNDISYDRNKLGTNQQQTQIAYMLQQQHDSRYTYPVQCPSRSNLALPIQPHQNQAQVQYPVSQQNLQANSQNQSHNNIHKVPISTVQSPGNIQIPMSQQNQTQYLNSSQKQSQPFDHTNASHQKDQKHQNFIGSQFQSQNQSAAHSPFNITQGQTTHYQVSNNLANNGFNNLYGQSGNIDSNDKEFNERSGHKIGISQQTHPTNVSLQPQDRQNNIQMLSDQPAQIGTNVLPEHSFSKKLSSQNGIQNQLYSNIRSIPVVNNPQMSNKIVTNQISRNNNYQINKQQQFSVKSTHLSASPLNERFRNVSNSNWKSGNNNQCDKCSCQSSQTHEIHHEGKKQYVVMSQNSDGNSSSSTKLFICEKCSCSDFLSHEQHHDQKHGSSNSTLSQKQMNHKKSIQKVNRKSYLSSDSSNHDDLSQSSNQYQQRKKTFPEKRKYRSQNVQNKFSQVSSASYFKPESSKIISRQISKVKNISSKFGIKETSTRQKKTPASSSTSEQQNEYIMASQQRSSKPISANKLQPRRKLFSNDKRITVDASSQTSLSRRNSSTIQSSKYNSLSTYSQSSGVSSSKFSLDRQIISKQGRSKYLLSSTAKIHKPRKSSLRSRYRQSHSKSGSRLGKIQHQSVAQKRQSFVTERRDVSSGMASSDQNGLRKLFKSLSTSEISSIPKISTNVKKSSSTSDRSKHESSSNIVEQINQNTNQGIQNEQQSKNQQNNKSFELKDSITTEMSRKSTREFDQIQENRQKQTGYTANPNTHENIDKNFNLDPSSKTNLFSKDTEKQNSGKKLPKLGIVVNFCCHGMNCPKILDNLSNQQVSQIK